MTSSAMQPLTAAIREQRDKIPGRAVIGNTILQERIWGIFSRIFSETSSMETHLLADRLRTDLDEVDLAAGALICMQM